MGASNVSYKRLPKQLGRNRYQRGKTAAGHLCIQSHLQGVSGYSAHTAGLGVGGGVMLLTFVLAIGFSLLTFLPVHFFPYTLS